MGKTFIKTQPQNPLHDMRDSSLDEIYLYEQRCLPRWIFSVQAYYRICGRSEVFKTQTRDLSFVGGSFYIGPHVRLNEKIILKIFLSPLESFEAEGTVIWKRLLGDDDCYAGVFFNTLSDENQELILKYVYESPDKYHQLDKLQYFGANRIS